MNEKDDYKNNGKPSKPVNLKLSPDIKEKFKNITHQRHTSMQDVLYAFVDAYIENPDRFKIRMEVQ